MFVDNIFVFFAVKKIFPDLIHLLPTNCNYAVRKWSPNVSEIDSKFEELSEDFDDHIVIYEDLLPFVYEKCGYNVLDFIVILSSAIKDADKKEQLHEFKTSKCTMQV